MRMGVAGRLGLSDAIDHQESGQILSGCLSAASSVGHPPGQLGKMVAPPRWFRIDFRGCRPARRNGHGRDGVDNLRDHGSIAVSVDADGCPVDSDGDGYADYRDEEPHSRHTRVDGRGVVIDPLQPMTADWDTVRGQVASDLTDWSGYTLRVPKPEEGWTNAEQQTLLAFTHLKETSEAIEVQVGDDPDKVDEALRRSPSRAWSRKSSSPSKPLRLRPLRKWRAWAAVANANSTAHYRVSSAFRAPAEENLTCCLPALMSCDSEERTV